MGHTYEVGRKRWWSRCLSLCLAVAGTLSLMIIVCIPVVGPCFVVWAYLERDFERRFGYYQSWAHRSRDFYRGSKGERMDGK